MKKKGKTRMNWANLLSDRCPKCSTELVESPGAHAKVCGKVGYPDDPCDFAVSHRKLEELKYNLQNQSTVGFEGKRSFPDEEGYGD